MVSTWAFPLPVLPQRALKNDREYLAGISVNPVLRRVTYLARVTTKHNWFYARLTIVAVVVTDYVLTL